ncbi:hypothetical protein E2C01_004701 [Portunus trituberculatus]|uniref:Uncharacterized protein n=1 Tax=Portunus trituberculatus TaxID=210409 RepID=A0A5B7CTP9_PORTR|nr:hypothetical protein [Portunus trituberculatus]
MTTTTTVTQERYRHVNTKQLTEEKQKNARPPKPSCQRSLLEGAGRDGAGREGAGEQQRRPSDPTPPMVGGGGTWWAARRSTTRGETVLPAPPPRLSLSPLISSPQPQRWPARLEGTGESESTGMARCGRSEGTRQAEEVVFSGSTSGLLECWGSV